jgi:putative aldouronate transport system substrate-binding protein
MGGIKMRIRKTISAIVAITTLAAVLVGLSGCGKKEEANGKLLWYTFGERPENFDDVMVKVNEIVQKEIGVELDMQFIDSASYQEKMKLKMASGEPYDIAFTGYINRYHTAVDLGGLYDITKLIKEVKMDEVIPEFYLDSAKVDGKIYGIPNIQVVSNPICISMNKSLAKQVNADLPAIQEAACNAKNLDDLKKYAEMLDDLFEKIHNARPDLYVLNPKFNLILDPMWENLMNDIYIRRDGSSMELVDITKTEYFDFAIEKINEWYSKGYIRKDIASKGYSTSEDELKLIAVRPDTWKPGQSVTDAARYGEEQEYAFIHYPYVSRTSTLNTMNSVGANSKNPKKAVEFLKLLNSNKELFNLICWGIEDVNYTKDADGFVTPTEAPDYKNNGRSAWKYGNQFNSLIMVGQSADVWEETEKMNNEAVKSPMLGFVPDTNIITNEIANITSVDDEYKAKTAYGTDPYSVWKDEYQNKLEQAGSDKVLKELQKQFDEFVKNK